MIAFSIIIIYPLLIMLVLLSSQATITAFL